MNTLVETKKCSRYGLKKPMDRWNLKTSKYHCNDKESNIATLMASTCSLQVLQDEMDKCEVVCANRHKIRTATRSNFTKLVFRDIQLLQHSGEKGVF